jgi:signal transduction histidine kinase
MAEQELERVSHITRQTLGFYRDSSEPEPVQMRAVIESVLKVYDNKMKSKPIAVELDVADCPPVHGLQGELKQLIGNLVSNATDAVSSGGRIRISVRPAVRAQGNGVEITVADSGPGVALENRARIFEPFFTTKQDVGTGLGLWVSREIAGRHGGSIEVSSDKDNALGGAVFTVFLPFEAQTEAVSGAA